MDGMTKTSVKDMKTKPDGCEPEEEEKPDMRSKYTMINLIKNKLRAAGQRDPMIMMKDPVMGEENISEMKPAKKKKIHYSEYPELVDTGRGGNTANVDVEPAVLKTYRNVRTVGSLLPAIGKTLIGDKDAFKKQEKAERKRYKNPQGLERVMTGFADKLTKDKYDFDKKGPSKMKEEVVNEDEKKKIETMIKTKKMNGKDLTPEQLQGLDAGLTQGGNPSVLNPPKKKKEIKPSGEKKKDTAPKYNPYGKGATANPSNMSSTTGP